MHKKRFRYPHCTRCGAELNPNKWDDYEKYYLTDDGVTCKDCFLDGEKDWLESNLDEFAELVGVPVIYVEN